MAMRSGNSYYLPSPSVTGQSQGKAPTDVNTKYILVTGGVCSSLGKGVTTSTLGALLKAEGFRVSAIKIDPYINVDAGLMSPLEHGEVYVLGDGGEVDLDLGNYERWLGVKLHRDHNITTGKVYQRLIERERRGIYLGKTVQVVPHFTTEVQDHIRRMASIPVDDSAQAPHVVLIELGGTVGDLESAPFIEALRCLRFSSPPEDFVLVHCTYLPVMGGGQKTKPTQHSARTLLSLGLTPDFLVCRSEKPLDPSAKQKLSQQCGIGERYIIGAHDVSNLYEVPVLFAQQDVIPKLVQRLRLNAITDHVRLIPPVGFPTAADWEYYTKTLNNPVKEVTIAFVGKYLKGGDDAYFSVLQSFEHCRIALEVKINWLKFDTKDIEKPEELAAFGEELKKCDGIFVPGGFGLQGTEAKIYAAKIARENSIAFFGVCYGFQTALIEIARDVLGWEDATSEEIDAEGRSNHHIVRWMPEIDRDTMGANMRLGSRDVHVESSSLLYTYYARSETIAEKHRHRYEFNMKFHKQFLDCGVRFVASDDPNFGENCRMEGFEYGDPRKQFFLGVQYHPEFRTMPSDPSPPFLAFVAAASKIPYDWDRKLSDSRMVMPKQS